MAEITIRLVTADDAESSRKLKQNFVSDIEGLSGVTTADVNFRGDPVTLGAIVLGAIVGIFRDDRRENDWQWAP